MNLPPGKGSDAGLRPGALDAAREFVRGRLSGSSIRRVADESGLKKGVIAGFAAGTVPHPLNARALIDYHQRYVAQAAATADTREITDDELREYFAEEYQRVGSLRRVATAAGVTFSSLKGFLDDAKATQPRVRGKLAAHYFAREGRLSDPKPEAAAGERAPRQRSAAAPSGALIQAREFILGYVNSASVESVASDVGPPVTPKVLTKFLAGSVPRPRNAEALIAFHERAQSSGSTVPRTTDLPTQTESRLEAVRELVRYRAQREPLRVVAEESGLSAALLQSFVRGSMPLTKNRQKLLDWYESLAPERRAVPARPRRGDEEEPAVDHVRELIARRQSQIGMYLLADELGVSTTPVRDFVAGSPPTHRTWEKLVAWYRVRKAAGLVVLPPKLSKEIRFQPAGDTPCRTAVGILIDAFPVRERRLVRRRVVEALAAEHQNAGRDLPDWIRALLNDPDPPRWYGTRTGLASRRPAASPFLSGDEPDPR